MLRLSNIFGEPLDPSGEVFGIVTGRESSSA
jgi:hypothetical protein